MLSAGRAAPNRNPAALFPFAHAIDAFIAAGFRSAHTARMRVLAILLLVAGVIFGIYQYTLTKAPTTDPGTAPTQAIGLTGVRTDLLQIAQAERGYVALNGHCASLDELLSSGSLSLSRPERDGYSYTVDCAGSSGDFSATARHAPAPSGSPIRYPTLAIDQSMQVREVN
jgi:hypothetical protein